MYRIKLLVLAAVAVTSAAAHASSSATDALRSRTPRSSSAGIASFRSFARFIGRSLVVPSGLRIVMVFCSIGCRNIVSPKTSPRSSSAIQIRRRSMLCVRLCHL